jgi:hypothetical protein
MPNMNKCEDSGISSPWVEPGDSLPHRLKRFPSTLPYFPSLQESHVTNARGAAPGT